MSGSVERSPNHPFNPGLFAELACIWEATARKPGNVHCRRNCADLTYLDFLHSAAAVAPELAEAAHRPVGVTILRAIQATRRVAHTNTNLGIVLLLAPLAAVPANESLEPGLERILANLTLDDSRQIFAAIRLACPGGLGRASREDVAGEPTLPFRQIMALAADRDLIARQYANGFREVLHGGLPRLRGDLAAGHGLEEAIILTQLHFLAAAPDSLIARRHGLDAANEVSREARALLARSRAYDFAEHLARFDHGLCAQRKNPGTSADLVAACLFAALRECIIKVPLEISWSRGWQHG